MLKKYYLGGLFWAPIPHKRYQNTYGFAAASFYMIGTSVMKMLILNIFSLLV